MYLDITGEVEEVVTGIEILVDLIGQILNGVLVGNVFDHQRGPGILPNIHRVDLEDSVVIVPHLLCANVVALCLFGVGITGHLLGLQGVVDVVRFVPVDRAGVAEALAVGARTL